MGPMWKRIRDAFRALAGRAPAPARPAAPSRLERDLAEVRAGLQALAAELRQLREAAPERTLHIDKVEHLTVEQLYHIIGRLEVDQLDGTLNVGISRNLRVGPRLPAEVVTKRAENPRSVKPGFPSKQ